MCQILVAKKYVVKLYQICAIFWLPKSMLWNYIKFVPNQCCQIVYFASISALCQIVHSVCCLVEWRVAEKHETSHDSKSSLFILVLYVFDLRFIQDFHFLCFNSRYTHWRYSSMQCQNCLTLVILPNQLAIEYDLRFLKLDCDPVLSDLNLTASKMASDGAPCLVCWVQTWDLSGPVGPAIL